MLEYVSVDVGYGFVKAKSSSGKTVCFPSVVGNGRNRGLASLLNSNEGKIDLSQLHIRIDGTDYYLGDMAIRDSENSTRIFERERFRNENTLILLHSAIQMVVSPKCNAVVLSTGLPLEYFKSQQNDFKETLMKKSLEVEWIEGMPKATRKIRIVQSIILPQGMASFYAILMNSENKINYPDLTEGSEIAVIDVGYRTTDVCVAQMQSSIAFKPIIPLSNTIDSGVVNLIQNIKSDYHELTGGAALDDSKAERIIERGYITFRGKKLDFKNTVKKDIEKVTDSILDKLSTLWKDRSDTFDKIFVVGGGGRLFKEFLQNKFNNQLIYIEQSQFANATGYLRVAKLMVPIDKIMKELRQEIVG